MKKFNGKPASPGIASAKVFKLETQTLDIKKEFINDTNQEIKKLQDAMVVSKKEIEAIKNNAIKKLGAEHAAIFDAHIQILEDPAFKSESTTIIEGEKVCAEFAYNQVAQKFIEMFAQMDDLYMKERASDIKDVSSRVLHHILGVKIKELTSIDHDVVIVAEDLSPSQTAQLNSYVKAFVTTIGGSTSHSAIMARSLELPAVVGATSALENCNDGDIILVNGSTGECTVNPSDDLIKKANQEAATLAQEKEELKKLINQESITSDGHKVLVGSNIGTPQDMDQVIKNGAEIIGLFRSEFLYMNSSNWPDEEKQFQSYKEVLEKMEGKGVVIRTLDIGGDKFLPYFKFPEELNPFLGYRAIRMCLDKEDIFRTQLRALLRASAFGKLHIMFPLIATIEEFRKAKTILLDEETKLKKEKVKIGKYDVGMMMEVPSAVVLADKFAKEADFFSIGTNDLLQYTFACDRMNNEISYLYQPLNPATLRLIKKVIDASHKEGKWTAMCGEMAGNPEAIQILLGLGLDEFSMSAISMLKAKSIIRNSSYKECQILAQKALDCATEQEVKKLINK